MLTVFEHCCAHYWLAKHYKSIGRLKDAKKMFAAYAHLRAACGIDFDIIGHKRFNYRRSLLEKEFDKLNEQQLEKCNAKIERI